MLNVKSTSKTTSWKWNPAGIHYYWPSTCLLFQQARVETFALSPYTSSYSFGRLRGEYIPEGGACSTRGWKSS